MSQLSTILGGAKQTNVLCVVMFADKTGGSDVPNTDADWAFFLAQISDRWRKVLHYLSASAFSHSKYFFGLSHWGNSERILQMLFHFKTFDALPAAHFEMSSK